MKNAVNRDIPDELLQNGRKPFMGSGYYDGAEYKKDAPTVRAREKSFESKLLPSIREAVQRCAMKDGMTVSFHHHFREGDYIINMVMKEIVALGIKDITIAASSVGAAHDPVAEYIEQGIVTGLQTSGIRGRMGEAVSHGKLKTPAILRSHGGRVRAVERGEVHIDIAFIGAPTSDCYGNARGVGGKSDCGVLSYAMVDAQYADKVVIITDTLVDFPNFPPAIQAVDVDWVVVVDAIGDPGKIATKAARMSQDPRDLMMAEHCARVMAATPYFKDGFSFQTGAGGPSLAANRFLEPLLLEKNYRIKWIIGGITKPAVDLLNKGLVEMIVDAQDFDIDSVQSVRDNPRHYEISVSQYASPGNKGAFVNKLDFVILAALEVDTDFNVNVITGSDGVLRGAPGGHPDASAGAKCTIIVTPLVRGRMATICEHVVTVTTPGECVDVVVTDYGIAVNPRRQDLFAPLKEAGLPLKTIEELKDEAYRIVGVPNDLEFYDRVVAILEARDGTVLDVVRQIKPMIL
ncbi:MAG: citrate lyase subunit alpha [Eubacteriales bacterium]|nr:citrate lyase subunit alpha [Eubacteriales bacterium]MDD3571397.1 citrate lyase subunit alpha [Eubacteriales bacterium]MDD4135037.1 citrate lyase subunit alpha [Eubacteriales bacterium]